MSVLPFKPKEPQKVSTLTCCRCGSGAFRIYASEERIECTECGTKITNISVCIKDPAPEAA